MGKAWFRSVLTVAGAFWSVAASAHQPHDPIVSLGVSPAYATDQTLFIGTHLNTVTLGVRVALKSSDGGSTWRVVNDVSGSHVSKFALSSDFQNDGAVFAATLGAGLFKSTDRGESWVAVGSVLGAVVEDVVMSPAYTTDATVFAVNGENRLFRSIDGGSSWSDIGVPNGLPGSAADVYPILAISPEFGADQTLLVGTMGYGILRSTDAGSSWTAMNQGLINQFVATLVFSPSYAQDRGIFAGTSGGGVFFWLQPGERWAATNDGLTDLRITSIALSPFFSQDGTLFVASTLGGVFRSTNRGVSWAPTGSVTRPIDTPQTTFHYMKLAVAPGSTPDSLVVFLGMHEGFWKSSDSGNSWLYSDILPSSLIRSLVISPGFATGPSIFASTYGGGILLSADGGANWTHRNTGLLNPYPDPVALSPGYPEDPIILCGTVWGLQRSVSFTANWQVMQMLGVATFARALAVSPGFVTDRTVFIGTDNEATPNRRAIAYNGETISTDGVFVSNDTGYTWAPTGLNGVRIQSISVSPAFVTDRTLFAASYADGFYKSTDGGETWAMIHLTVSGTEAFAIALSPGYADDQTLFASTIGHGVFKSIDGGNSWSLVPGSETATVLDIAISPNYPQDQTFFIGTLQKGLLKSVDGGGSLMPANLPGNYVTSIAVSPAFASDGTLFAATYQGIFKSTDGGGIWNSVLSKTRVEEDRPTIVYSGTWATVPFQLFSSTFANASSEQGAQFEYRFIGTGVAWIGGKGPQHGIASIYFDGVFQTNIDLYTSKGLTQQRNWMRTGLAPGHHTLTVVVTGLRNPAAAGSTVTLDAIDTWSN